MESHLRKKSRKWEIRVAPLLLLLPPLLISLDDGFCRSTLSPIFAKYRDERRGTDADEGDPSKMLRDDDTFVLTGVKSDIALFPLQLPRRTQTWTDLWPARRNPSLSKWLEMPFPFQAPSLGSSRSLNPATSPLARINIPNNHAGRVTNAVPAPLAANWTRSGMLAQVLSYASVGDSQFSVAIATGKTKLFQLFLRFQRRLFSV